LTQYQDSRLPKIDFPNSATQNSDKFQFSAIIDTILGRERFLNTFCVYETNLPSKEKKESQNSWISETKQNYRKPQSFKEKKAERKETINALVLVK